MAAGDKLWFDLGVRDNVTNTLNTLLTKAEALKSTLKDISMEKGIYENALKVEQAYDKIDIALQRIKEAKKKTSDPMELDQLNKAEAKLREYRREWKHLGSTQKEMATKGSAALLATKQGLSLALEQVTRLANGIDKASDAEIKGLDALKRKYYEVSSMRKTLGDAITNAAPGVDTAAAMAMYRKMMSWEGNLSRAINNGYAMPKSVQGADFDEYMRQAKNMAKVLGTETVDAENRAAQSAQNLANVNKGLMESYYKVSEAGKGTNKIMDQLRNQFAGYISLYGLERMAKSIVTIGGQFEFQHVALQNILGDLQQANTLFSQLQEMAVESPKTFMELTSYTKQLSAYQIPYEELFDTTKRLADISTGLGVDMSRLILAYGQVRSAAVLRGQELRQFTEAGIPLVQKLAEKFSELNGKAVTTGEVFELISKRAVPFKMVKEILFDMTDEGGQFFDMQSKLADTLYGKYQKLQDSWQIMLGRIADGKNIMGRTFKAAIEGVVGLVNSIDTLIPAIGSLALGRFLHSGGVSIMGAMDKATGATAIRNMELAKLKEAVHLERERVMYGRQLNSYEQQLVATKSQLSAREYALLAQAGELSRKKTQQLIQEGKINRQTLMRLALEQGITKEKIRQMSVGEVAEAVGLFSGGGVGSSVGSKILGFMGGWFGVAMTSAGVLMSLYQRVTEQAERAGQASEASTSAILSDLSSVNGLYDQLTNKRPKTDKEYESAIARMTSVLKDSGNYSEEIQKQVEGTNSLTEKYVILYGQLQKVSEEYLLMKDNVKAYLDEANRSGEGNWLTKLFNDNMIEDLSDWSKKNISVRVAKKGVDKYASVIRAELERQLKEIGKWVEGEMREMDWEQLFNNSSINKRDASNLIYAKVGEEAYEAIYKYMGALGELSRAEKEVDSQMQEYADHVTVALEDAMKAQGLDMSKMLEWDDESLRKFEKATNEIIGNYNLDGKTAKEFKDKLYEKLLDEPVLVRIKALPVIEGSDLAPWQQDLQQYFNNNKLNIHIDAQTSMEQLEKDLQNKREEWQSQIDRSGKILVQFGFDLSSLPDDINKAIEKVPFWMRDYVKKAFLDYKEGSEMTAEADRAGKDLGLKVTKKETKSSSGSKKDKVLDDWKNRISMLEKYRKELEELEKYMTRAEAENKLRNEGGFGTLFGYFKNPNDYKASIDEAIKAMGTKLSGDRQKFVDEQNAKKSNEDLRLLKDNAKDAVSELSRLLGVMSENYNVYKKWVDLTGDAELAARIAGVTQNTTYADYLKEAMSNALKKTKLALTAEDVFGLKEGEARKLGKDNEIFKLWEEWQKNLQKIKKDQLDLYEDAIKNSKNYEDKIADVNRKLKEQIAAYEMLARTDEERKRLTRNATRNAEDKISEILWEQFQKENDWGRVFGEIDNMSLDTIKKMVDAMKDFQKNTRLSEKETRAWQKAMKDLTDKKIVLDPLNSIAEAVKDLQSATNRRKIIESQIETTKNNPELSEDKKQSLLNRLAKLHAEAIDDETEAYKRAMKSLKAFASELSNLGTSLSNIGNSVGGSLGDVLNGAGSILGDLGKGIDAFSNLDKNKTGFSGVLNKVTVAASVVSTMVDMTQKLDSLLPDNHSLYEHYAAQQREINKTREAIDDYAVAVAKAAESENNWLYKNDLSSLKSKGNESRKVLESYLNTLLSPQEIYQNKGSGLSKWAAPIIGAIAGIIAGVFTFGLGSIGGVALGSAIAGAIGTTATAAAGAAIAAGAGAMLTQVMQSAVEQITYEEGQTSARNNMRVQTQHASFWRGEKTENLEEWARERYGELFERIDGVDFVNKEVAEAILNSEETLVGETRETLERLLELRKQYDEFQEEIRSYVSNAFSPLASNMADAIWDWLDSGKDALDSFKDYAGDTFKSVAQEAVKSFLKIKVMDQFQDTLEALYKNYGLGIIDEQQLMLGVASIAGNLADSFEAVAPVAEQLAKTIADAFEGKGIDIVGNESSSSSTANSIKSVTEQTADLLASYINAIRADVSVNRFTLTEILIAVQAQTDMPVIARAQLTQLEQIAGNTRRNADSAAQIYDLLHALAPDGTKWRGL